MSGRGKPRRLFDEGDGGEERARRQSKRAAETKSTTNIIFACIAISFIIFLITALVLVIIHFNKDHRAPLEPLKVCNKPVPVSLDPCEEWLCLVIDGRETPVLTRSTNDACETLTTTVPLIIV